jgi:hypothetical protein
MDIKDFWKELDDAGEVKVRQNIASGRYAPDYLAMAHGWIAHKRQERERSDSFASADRDERMIAISLSSKRAAWVAAIAAIVAAIAAIVAITLHIQ